MATKDSVITEAASVHPDAKGPRRVLAMAGVLGLHLWSVLNVVPALEHGLGVTASVSAVAALTPLAAGLWLAARERPAADLALLALFPTAAGAAAVTRPDGALVVLGSALGVLALAASLLGYGAACLHLLEQRQRSRVAEHHRLAEDRGAPAASPTPRVRLAQRALLGVSGAAAMALATLAPFVPLPGAAHGAATTAAAVGLREAGPGAGGAPAHEVGTALAQAREAWGDAAPQGLLLVAVVSSGLGVALIAAIVGPALRAERSSRAPRRRMLLASLALLAAATGLAALAAYRAAGAR